MQLDVVSRLVGLSIPVGLVFVSSRLFGSGKLGDDKERHSICNFSLGVGWGREEFPRWNCSGELNGFPDGFLHKLNLLRRLLLVGLLSSHHVSEVTHFPGLSPSSEDVF